MHDGPSTRGRPIAPHRNNGGRTPASEIHLEALVIVAHDGSRLARAARATIRIKFGNGSGKVPANNGHLCRHRAHRAHRASRPEQVQVYDKATNCIASHVSRLSEPRHACECTHA